MNKQSSSLLKTNEAGRIVTRLCKHWSHRFEVVYDEKQGEIHFEQARCLLKVADDGLYVELKTESTELLEQLKQVFFDHAIRMAKEPLEEAEWCDAV